MNDERIAEHAAEVIAWLHSEESRGWTYNDLELRIRLAIRGALADPRLSDHSRRIAEMEQANRDLERLRVEASRECDEAQEHRRILREWIEKDKTGLYAALTKIVKAIEARGWITDGRGPYEWDDDRYREEAGWAFDEVRKIVVDAQKESDKRMRSALTETPES